MSKTNIILSLLNALGLIFLAGALIFLWWRSNQPEAVYNRGMYSIGKAFSKISQPENLEKLVNYRFTGSLSITGLNGEFRTGNEAIDQACQLHNNDRLEVEASFARETIAGHFQAEAGLNDLLSAQIRLINQADGLDLYFYLEPGPCSEAIMEDISDSPAATAAFGSGLLAGNWWHLSLDELLNYTDSDLEAISDWQITWDEIDQDSTEFYQAISDQAKILSRYLFTGNPANMVIQQDQLIAKHVDFKGTDTHHYSAKLNRANLKKMVADSSQALERLVDPAELADWRDASQDLLAEIDKNANLETETIFEVWVATDTKVLRCLRLSNPDNRQEYIQLEFLLKDDVFTVGFDSNVPDDPVYDNLNKLQLDFDTKTQAINLTFEFTNQDRSYSLKLQSAANETALEIKVPKEYRTVNLQKLIRADQQMRDIDLLAYALGPDIIGHTLDIIADPPPLSVGFGNQCGSGQPARLGNSVCWSDLSYLGLDFYQPSGINPAAMLSTDSDTAGLIPRLATVADGSIEITADGSGPTAGLRVTWPGGGDSPRELEYVPRQADELLVMNGAVCLRFENNETPGQLLWSDNPGRAVIIFRDVITDQISCVDTYY